MQRGAWMFCSVVVGTIAMCLGIAAEWLFSSNSPFMRLEVLILAACVVSIFAFLLSVRILAPFAKCISAALSLVGGITLSESMSGVGSHSVDSIELAFATASMKCQIGACLYKTTALEERSLLGSKEIHSQILAEGSTCRVLSMAINPETCGESMIADYEQFKMASYVSRTRFLQWFFRSQYPSVTLVSRGVVDCPPKDVIEQE